MYMLLKASFDPSDVYPIVVPTISKPMSGGRS